MEKKQGPLNQAKGIGLQRLPNNNNKRDAMDITPPTIEELAVVLQNSGVALLPTDTVWSAVVLLDSRRGFGKLEHCLAMVPGLPWPELLVRDTEQAKQYIAHLHPRLETLWNHHTRPLSILFDNPVNLPPGLLQADGGVVLRLVTDVFLKRLIEKLGLPLIALPAFTAQGEVALHFDEISGALKEQMDYIAGNQGRGIAPGEISVMVRLTAIEELEFIRE